MDTFGEVACTERSRAGSSHCATPTEKCTQEGFFPSRKRSCGTRPCAPILYVTLHSTTPRMINPGRAPIREATKPQRRSENLSNSRYPSLLA
eukprot:scaffold47912_cov73-Phaeocystis_antarctica.AAC.11